MMRFETHKQIPDFIQSYLKTVSRVEEISLLSLYDINSFLKGLDEFHEEFNGNRLGL